MTSQDPRIDRRRFLRNGALSLGGLAFTGLFPHSLYAATAAERTSRPNVLFLAIDDLNDWIGCLGGHPQAHTPNIDRLAASGMLFERAYCAAAACVPSRCAMLSGMWPANSGCLGNHYNFKRSNPDHVTMLTHFRDNGYRVLGAGKIHHDRSKLIKRWEQEYDVWQPPRGGARASRRNGLSITRNMKWGPIDAGELDTMDGLTVQWCMDQLARHDRTQPLFLACGIKRPHLPWCAPRKFFDMFPPDKVQLPPHAEGDLRDMPEAGQRMAHNAYGDKPSDHEQMLEEGLWKEAVGAYLATVAFIDSLVGHLLDALENEGYANNTHIVLWGDHGWHLGEKEHWKKFTCWEDGTRNPLIIAGPGIQAGRCPWPVSLVDVFPTLIDLCELPDHPQGLDGRSLVPQMENPDAAPERPAISVYDNKYDFAMSVRTRRWRYIRYADASEELYDHSSDPLELVNLAAIPEYAEDLEILRRWLPDTKFTRRAAEVTAKRRRKL